MNTPIQIYNIKKLNYSKWRNYDMAADVCVNGASKPPPAARLWLNNLTFFLRTFWFAIFGTGGFFMSKWSSNAVNNIDLKWELKQIIDRMLSEISMYFSALIQFSQYGHESMELFSLNPRHFSLILIIKAYI